nr:immunoglobulin light chain junction region [Macaca mulatta]
DYFCQGFDSSVVFF